MEHKKNILHKAMYGKMLRWKKICPAALAMFIVMPLLATALDYPFDPMTWDANDPNPYNPSNDLGVYYMGNDGFDLPIKTIAEDPILSYDVEIVLPESDEVVFTQHVSGTGGQVREYQIHIPQGPLGRYEIQTKNGPVTDRFMVEELVIPCSVTTCTDTDSDTFTQDLTCNEEQNCTVCNCNDCNDSNADTYPNATEICDGQDNDCDDIINDDEKDNDNDGFMPCSGDCNDLDSTINPDAIESCDNTIDDDCDGAIDCSDIDCSTDPSCTSGTCSEKENPCENTEECCNALKCKKEIDSPTLQKICCEKDECAHTTGCLEENTCITTDHKIITQRVCAHGTWIPKKKAEQNCMDEIDNDCDGFIDCKDHDCETKPPCTDTACATDSDCKSDKICENGRCKALFCTGCAQPENHTCIEQECCSKKDCSSDEICSKNICIQIPKNEAQKNRYIKESTKGAIDNAEKKIEDKKQSGFNENINTLEKKLKNAKVAYNNEEYEKAETIATEIIKDGEKPKGVIGKIKAYFHKIRLFLTPEKEIEPIGQQKKSSFL